MDTPSSFRDVSNRRLILLGIGNFSHSPQRCCSRCLSTLFARARPPQHAETVLRYRCEMCEGRSQLAGSCSSSSLGERHGVQMGPKKHCWLTTKCLTVKYVQSVDALTAPAGVILRFESSASVLRKNVCVVVSL